MPPQLVVLYQDKAQRRALRCILSESKSAVQQSVSRTIFVFPLSVNFHNFEIIFSQKVNVREIVHEKKQTVNEFNKK